MSTTAIDRRAVARDISRLLDAPVATVLARLSETPLLATRRIGLTGSPGAGKSTLIAALAPRRLQRRAKVAVLAIDPSSPISGGSLLGDRIRMDAVASHPQLYIRSVPSRNAHDGLCDNAPDLLLALEQHGFDEILLETVGVGQAEFEVRALVDTLVLVLQAETGDGIQAMKAGVLEMADVVVLNKADLAGVERLESALRGTLRAARRSAGQWQPPVVLTAADGRGLAELDAAIEAHGDWARAQQSAEQVAEQRRRYHLSSLLARRVAEVLNADAPDAMGGDLQDAYRRIVAGLQAT